jgi:hypothetical protein
LLISFKEVILVDTKGINPNHSCFAGTPKSSQRIPDIGSNIDHAIF